MFIQYGKYVIQSDDDPQNPYQFSQVTLLGADDVGKQGTVLAPSMMIRLLHPSANFGR